jgi:uncharacterized membrane protein
LTALLRFALHEIDIEAPLDTVWTLHLDVNVWPTWQTDITAAHIDGTPEPGVWFDWTSYGFIVTSTVYDVNARTRVLWGGTPGEITGVHEWLFSDTPTGVEREYSIATAPGEPAAIMGERLETARCSPYVTEELRAGDGIELRGPLGGYLV